MSIGTLNVTSTVETGVFRGLGETGVIEVIVSRRDDLNGGLGRGRSRLDVAGVIGRHAVEAVRVTGLAGEEGGRTRGRHCGEVVNGPPSVDS